MSTRRGSRAELRSGHTYHPSWYLRAKDVAVCDGDAALAVLVGERLVRLCDVQLCLDCGGLNLAGRTRLVGRCPDPDNGDPCRLQDTEANVGAVIQFALIFLSEATP